MFQPANLCIPRVSWATAKTLSLVLLTVPLFVGSQKVCLAANSDDGLQFSSPGSLGGGANGLNSAGASLAPGSSLTEFDMNPARVPKLKPGAQDDLVRLANKIRADQGKAPLTPSEATAIAQSTRPPRPAQQNHIPGIVGSVQIRKPFKLFAREQLIHNLSFRETPVKEVIEEIARRGGLNILIDKSVSGKITGDLRDVTLNEAMDSVLAAAGLQSRTLDNNTVIIATTQAMVQLGLNRPIAKAFKLSYASPYDVAMLIYASIFNKGALPDFQNKAVRRDVNERSDANQVTRIRQANGLQAEGSVNEKAQNTNNETEKNGEDHENTQTTRLDNARTVRGATRVAVQEGVGFNNAATDPGSQQIRAFQELTSDYVVEQNGGGALVIPDTKNRQVIVVGTADDVNVAEEAIRLLDRRPKVIHVQASLVELNNQAIRQLGTQLTIQGQGTTTSLLGNATAPITNALAGLPAGTIGQQIPNQSTTQIATVTPSNTAASIFNFLTLNSKAGGRANIATVPDALNVTLNLLLQTNKAKVVANPSVVVVDNTETLITIATEVIHKVTSTVSLSVVSSNVELTKAGIFLNVLPRVTEDGFIVMRLRPQVSSPTGPPQTFGGGTTTGGGVTVTLLSVREIMSQEVRVRDGQTLVLGGLFTEAEQAQIAKIPYLAETPVFGAFFRNTLKGRNRTELMLLITPKIVEEDPPTLTETVSPSM
jgi:type II secretory pathway component GspD/PulD (secretin)